MVSLLWLKLAINDNIPSPRDIVNKANWLGLCEREALGREGGYAGWVCGMMIAKER